MKAIRKYFPGIGDDYYNVVKLLKGYRGASLVRRIRYVRSGEYMLRIHDEQGGVIVCGPRIKSESESIRQYNDLIKSVGQDLPEEIPDEEPESEDDFFAAFDGAEDFEEDFFDQLENDDDEFFNAF